MRRHRTVSIAHPTRIRIVRRYGFGIEAYGLHVEEVSSDCHIRVRQDDCRVSCGYRDSLNTIIGRRPVYKVERECAQLAAFNDVRFQGNDQGPAALGPGT